MDTSEMCESARQGFVVIPRRVDAQFSHDRLGAERLFGTQPDDMTIPKPNSPDRFFWDGHRLAPSLLSQPKPRPVQHN